MAIPHLHLEFQPPNQKMGSPNRVMHNPARKNILVNGLPFLSDVSKETVNGLPQQFKLSIGVFSYFGKKGSLEKFLSKLCALF